jgi:hypothetical protein
MHAVLDEVLLDRKFASGHAAGRRHLVVQEGARVEQAYPQGLDLLGHGAEDGLGVAPLEGEEDLRGLEIGLEPGKEAPGGHLARHEGVARPEIPEQAQRLADLAHMHGVAVFRGKGGDELGGGLALEGDQAQRDARPRNRFGHEPGVDALARDQRDRERGVEGFRQVR